MGLRAQAASDAKKILNDATAGAGWPISLFDPASPAVEVEFVGFAVDISMTLDPDTDDYVSGQRATVALSITDIEASTLTGFPKGIADTTGRPWVCQFEGLDGNTYKFKVAKSMPDRAVNLLVLELEVYQ